MKGSIFFLENDKRHREEFRKAAEGRDLCVDCQDLDERDVREQAHCVSEGKYALALIDRRAKNDDDPGDDSGLIFAEKLHDNGAGTFSVLVTAHPMGAEIFDMFRHERLGGMVSKTEVRVHVLLRCVEHFFQFGVFPNGIARFVWLGEPPPEVAEWGENLDSRSWRLLRKRLGLDDEVEIEELELVLRALISPCATRVELKVYPHQGQGGTLLLQANVINVDTPVSEELAIKLGQKSTVKDEMLRYDRFVGPLPDGAAAQLRFRAETERLAAIAYSWVGDSVEEGVSFANLVRSDGDLMGWRVRRDAVRRLFATTLHRWYTVYRKSGDSLAPKPPQKLWDHYTTPGLVYPPGNGPDDISLPLDDMEEPIAASAGQTWTFQFGNTTEILPDPVDWARKTGKGIALTRLCPCHGDMHVGNVYVLPDSSPRLIDFGRTDLSHVFRDFAVIEASIRMTCVGTPEIALIRKAEDILGRVRSLGDAIDYEELGDKEEAVPLREALHVTNVIRRAALDAYVAEPGKDPMREYLFALVMHLLRYAAGVADECASEERKAEGILKLLANKAIDDCHVWLHIRESEAVLARRARRIWAAHYAAAKAATLANELFPAT